MGGIVKIQLGRLRKMLADRDIDLDIDDKALAWLADAGYDPVYGARPLKRVIQRALQNPLATLLLEGRIADGQKVEISAGEQGLLIDGIPAGTQSPARSAPAAQDRPGAASGPSTKPVLGPHGLPRTSAS